MNRIGRRTMIAMGVLIVLLVVWQRAPTAHKILRAGKKRLALHLKQLGKPSDNVIRRVVFFEAFEPCGLHDVRRRHWAGNDIWKPLQDVWIRQETLAGGDLRRGGIG